MSDMMDDINKYAAIWDDALAKGIFKDSDAAAAKQVRKSAETDEESFFGSDFFGQHRSAEYDRDEPLNEADTKYWAEVSKLADPHGYTDPLKLVESNEDNKRVADALAKSHNPIQPNSVGKDQEPEITQNWGVGGKEHFQLEELKVRLEKLEGKLNAMESEGKSGKDAQSKIDGLKKQIDELSDSLSGDRFSNG